MTKRMKYLFCAIIGVASLISPEGNGQAKVRKLSTIINHPSINLFAPYVSADANALVFLSDNAEDHVLTPFFSFRENADWQEPKVLPKNIHTRLNFLRGYGLSANGNTLYFSTMKSPGVGGFDIFTSEWTGSSWTNPVNMAAPINSRGHEACASITPDGKSMYFMRCERMDQNKAENCTIFRVDRKSNGQWDEPEELPALINTGNSQSPRIMADGETLIFSSDKMSYNKGGMDLYMTKLVNGEWSSPVALEFVNTETDDQYVSVSGLGRYLLRDSRGDRKYQLVEYLIPENIRPKGMMKIVGKVADPGGKPLPAYISLIDLHSGNRTYSGRPDSDGSFLIYAKEGTRYELAIDPEHANRTYYSKIYDLTSDTVPQVDKIYAVLKPLLPGEEFLLEGISFEDHSSELDLAGSESQLKRLVRVVTNNPDLKFEIQVLLEGYQEDSIQSDPDLTEVMYDSIHALYIDIDTLGQLYERDTFSVKATYHNDRTVRQSQAIIDYLIAQGADPENLEGFVSAAPAILPENKRTVIKARIN